MTIKRLFIGTFLSAEQQQQLAKLRDNNDALFALWHRKLRWVKPAKLHMTWLFLGDIESDRVEDVTSRLSEILQGRQAGAVAYDKIEFWPSARKPRQLVMTSQAMPEHLLEIAEDIRNGLRDFAVKPDDRRFRAHITLLRFDQTRGSVQKGQLALPDWLDLRKFLPVVHKVDNVALIESHMGGSRDDYETLQSCPLN